MHQILGLRPFYNEKKQKWDKTDNTFFKRNWRFKSLAELIADPKKVLEAIPEAERWNLYYTVAFCGDRKREFREQNVIIFDIDGCRLEDHKKYIRVVCETLQIKEQETGILISGYGMHFIIGLSAPIADPLYFDNTRSYYNAICAKLKAALDKEGLAGEPDPSVWDARRIMRLPGTINRKEGKEDRHCTILQSKIVEVNFNLLQASGLPEVKAQDQINPLVLKKISAADTPAVLSGCNFLKWTKENPNDVSEAQWYAMLSILPRLPGKGRELAHEYSSGHHSYSAAETEAKIEQATQASGPRTCQNIQGLWGNCESCPSWGKVTSPINIQSEEYIATESTGFHTVRVDSEGNVKKGKPNYNDLRKYFHRKHPYVILGESGICYIWNNRYWETYEDAYLENFAQEHFDPVAETFMTKEFRNLVCRTNLKPVNWFTDSTSKKLNLNNGILDLKTLELTPHSMNVGFRYCLDYDYDPTAKCPAFEKFLYEVMDGRQALVQVLLEFAGYAFSSDECWAEKALILTGEGGNGKSTFMNLVKALAGGKNYSSVTMTDLKNEANRKMLDGMLFNVAEETPTYAMAESSIFKNLVSGGDTTVKQLYKQPYSIANKAKLMFACNELPRTRDTTRGFLRKLLIIPFDKKFEGDDKDSFLREKLLAELPGILNLVIDGYRRLFKQKQFTTHKDLEAELDNYHRELDSVKAWFIDCCTVSEHSSEHKAVLSNLYQSYRLYADAQGEKPESLVTMGKRLKTILPDYNKRHKRSRINGKLETTLTGVKHADMAGF